MTRIKYFFLVTILSSWMGFASAQEDTLDLSGSWRFALDRKDIGENEEWFLGTLPGDNTIRLPGSLQSQGFGDSPNSHTAWTGTVRTREWSKRKYAPYRQDANFKMPFWLQPEQYYKGAAWYQRTVRIPNTWNRKRLTLTLERPHWQTNVWVDGQWAGSRNYLSVPHVYDLSSLLSPGEHTLTVRIDNRVVVDVGLNSHSVSDHTQSNWNGTVGDVMLRAETPVWIEDLQVFPNLAENRVKVRAQLASHIQADNESTLLLEIFFGQQKVAEHTLTDLQTDPKGLHTEAVIELTGAIELWNEFSPKLYTLRARLQSAVGEHSLDISFGMRDVAVDENRITLNGRRVFMRGTLECCIFPLTGYPPTDVESWKRIIRVCKAHGLNHIRFHSWCPPEAAFVAADELGFYYQVECSSWAMRDSSLGEGRSVDQWLYDEADAVLKAYGNHPSFLLFAYGNEPGGPNRGADYLSKWVSHYKQKDPRRLVTGGSGWPQIPENDFHVTHSGTRIQGWGQGLNSRINSQPPETVSDFRQAAERYPNQPTITHEMGQWCVYPDFNEIAKYTGVLKAKNFEVFRDFLSQKNMADQAHDFLMASGKLQTLCYKEDIESALRTPNFGGFQLLDLHDFPGQGTALVGVLDPFWDSKPYVTPDQFRRFCAAVAPLARLPKRIFVSSDTLQAQVDVSQFGPEDLSNANVLWTLADNAGTMVRQGALSAGPLATGDLHTVGDIQAPLAELAAPAKYTLTLRIENTDAVNDWDIWVYPDTVETDARGIRIVRELDDETVDFLNDGGNVFLAVTPSQVKTDVTLGFSSIFWNTAWTDGQAPHTLGVLCDPKHPALAQFPTEYHSNWQWSPPIQNAATMELDHLPVKLQPIVQVVPDWFEPKKLGLVFEAKVGQGALVMCSVDLMGKIAERPVQRQLRHSLLRYMSSDSFQPAVEVTVDQIRSIFQPPSRLQKLGAEIEADSAQSGYEASRATDGDSNTFWHSQYSPKQRLPQSLVLRFPGPIPIEGLVYLPRQDMANGRATQYAIYVSEDLQRWGEAVKRGSIDPGSKPIELRFAQPIEGRGVKLEILSGVADVASIAELDVLTGDQQATE